MFFDDIVLVGEAISKYGLQTPCADLGGLEKPTCADYRRTISSGVQSDRYIILSHPPFRDILGDYQIINPELGHPPIEALPAKYPEHFGTIVCLSVLEHVENPFAIFSAFAKLLKPNGLLVLSTVFSFPYHPSPNDNFRFSPSGLRILAESARLQVLECDWRLNITADMGIINSQNGKPQEIISVYVVARK